MSEQIVKQIDAAVAAHGEWKARLRSAIDTGASEFSVVTVQVDNQCAFGKWLYATTPAEQGASWAEVRDLHARFHAVAAGVLNDALTGHRTEAETAIALGSEFAKVSSALTRAMMQWKAAAAA